MSQTKLWERGGSMAGSKKYIINSETLMLLPYENNSTLVYELDKSFVVSERTFSIIKNSCLFFGSSFDGRREGTKSLLNCKIKVPIIIEESKEMLFFPTNSYRCVDNIWVSFNNLLKYTKFDKVHTVLHFKNNNEIKIKVSYNIVDNQIIRCIKLDSMFNRRKKELLGNYR